MSAFVLSKIFPSMSIDASQRFIFGLEGSPEPLGSFKLDNIYVPIIGSPSYTNLDLRNNALSGFRLRHETALGNTIGTLKVQSFLTGADTGTDLMNFNQNGTITFNSSVFFTDLNLSGKLQFTPATVNINKISLYNTTGNDYNQSGFGYSSLGTVYHAPSFTSHTFYLGNSSTVPLRVDSLGILLHELKPITSDPRRIMLHDEGENQHQIYNIGIKDLDGTNYAIHNQVSNLNAGFTWGAALGASSSADLMSLRGNTPTQQINLKIMNPLPAVVGLPAYTQIDLLNSTSGGVRFLHTSSSTDSVGLGSLKVQLVNSLGIESDAFTVSNDVFGPQTTFHGPAIFDEGITSFDNTVLLTGNAATFNPLVITNANTSGDTFLRFNNVLKIGYDNANFRTYLDTTVPFNITTSGTSRFYIDNATGNIGIGTLTPHAPLQLTSTTANRRIVLFEMANNDHEFYGYGVNNGVLRHQVANTAASFVFYAGVNSTTSNEVGRITGAGDFISPGTLYGRRPSGSLSMTGNATATVVAANTWTKVAGTTVSNASSNQFSQIANNRLAYNGTITLGGVSIMMSCSFIHNVFLGATVNFAIYKNGVQISTGMGSVQAASLNVNNATVLAFTSLSNGDYLEVFCRSSAAANITVSDMVITSIAS